MNGNLTPNDHVFFSEQVVPATNNIHESKFYIPLGCELDKCLYCSQQLCGFAPTQIVPCPNEGQGLERVGVEPDALCNSEEVAELPPICKAGAPDRVHEHPLAEGFLYGFLCGAALIVGLKQRRSQTCYDTLVIKTQVFPSLQVRQWPYSPDYHQCSWVPGILCGETQKGGVRQDQVRSCLLLNCACFVDCIHQHRNSIRGQVVPIHKKESKKTKNIKKKQILGCFLKIKKTKTVQDLFFFDSFWWKSWKSKNRKKP